MVDIMKVDIMKVIFSLDSFSCVKLLLALPQFIFHCRQLPPERLIFGRNYSEMVNPKGDWGRTATTRPCLTAIALTKWACVFPEKSKRPVQEFVKVMTQQASLVKCTYLVLRKRRETPPC